MHLKKYMDFYIGVFFLLFTLLYISQIPAIRVTRVSLIHSAAYPRVLAGLLLLLSAAQLFVALKRSGTHIADEDTPREYKAVAQTLFLVTAYVATLETLGFLVSSFVYLFLQILIMCPPAKIRIARFALIAAAASGIIYVVFRYGLKLMLPLGFLEDLLY